MKEVGGRLEHAGGEADVGGAGNDCDESGGLVHQRTPFEIAILNGSGGINAPGSGQWFRQPTRMSGEVLGTTGPGSVGYLKHKTLEWMLPTRITTLATNTTLATATRYDTAAKASLNLATKTTNCNTVIRSKRADTSSNSYTIAFVAGGSGVGALTLVGTAYTFTFATAVTTVTNFETAVAASVFLEVQTAGTGANLLAVVVDEFAATALAGGTTTQTLYCPETAERVFESVRLVVGYRSEWAATNSVIGWRTGIQIGSGPTVDFDRNPTAQNTASRNIIDEVDYDVTDYFNLYFTGTSQTCVASIAVASTVGANINQVTFKLIVTYAFDAKASTTRIKTVRIPLQSMTGVLSVSQQEFGTDGVNPVATKQIPALDTFCPELSKSFRQVFLELHAHDANASGTTAFTPYIQIDATAEVARATIDLTINTYLRWLDLYDLTGLDTSVSHTVSMRCDLASRLEFIGGILVITYEYDHPSTVTNNSALYSMFVALGDSIGNSCLPRAQSNVDLTSADRLVGVLDITEPGSPTLVQSGVYLMADYAVFGGSSTTVTQLPNQAASRQWAAGGSGGTSGDVPIMLRTVGGAWTLARGRNRFVLDVSHPTAIRGIQFAYAIINYTAGIREDVDNGNHMVNYACASYANPQSTTVVSSRVSQGTQGQRPPVMGSAYYITEAMILAVLRAPLSGGDNMAIEQRGGELDGGWSMAGASRGGNANPTNTVQSYRQMYWFTNHVNRSNHDTGKIDITQRRAVIAQTNTSWLGYASLSWWIGCHNHTFTVAGTVLVDGVAQAGMTVRILARQPTSLPNTPDVELVTTVTTDANGAYSASVRDNVRLYAASYDNGGRAGQSLWGTPV